MAQLRKVPLSKIEADGTFKYRCRDEQQASISRLAEDIKANGLLVPLLLKELGKGKYLLVAGYRRYAALLHLCNGGGQAIGQVDAHVYPRGTPRKTLLAARFAENVERKNLSPLDLAYAAERLTSSDELTHSQAADLLKLGSAKKVQRLLRLRKAPAGVRAAVHAGWLSFTAALAMMEAGDTQQVAALFNQVYEDHAANPDSAWSAERIRSAIRKSNRSVLARPAIAKLRQLGLGIRRTQDGQYSVSLKVTDLNLLSEVLRTFTSDIEKLNVSG